MKDEIFRLLVGAVLGGTTELKRVNSVSLEVDTSGYLEGRYRKHRALRQLRRP